MLLFVGWLLVICCWRLRGGLRLSCGCVVVIGWLLVDGWLVVGCRLLVVDCDVGCMLTVGC